MKQSLYTTRYNAVRRAALVYLPATHRRFLMEHHACLDACLWLFRGQFTSLATAYDYATNVEWMEWLLGQLSLWEVYIGDEPDVIRSRVSSARVGRALAFLYVARKRHAR